MNQKLNRIRQILVAFILLAAVSGITSCEKYSYTPPAVDPNTTWHFQTDIQPIFNANCVTCHGGTKSPDLRDGKSYLALTKGGYVNAPAESSKLYSKMSGSDHSARSTETDKLKVLYWITQGALNN
jgi:hypothetical protein